MSTKTRTEPSFPSESVLRFSILQSKDAENNSLIEHVMESEKGLKVSMQQASTAVATVAASSDQALFRRCVFLFSMFFILFEQIDVSVT